MAEADHLWKERLGALSTELDYLRSSSLNLNGEPEFRAVADPPAKSLIHAYLHALPGQQEGITTARPVFSIEVPLPPPNWRTSWLVRSLLLQWGDPAWDKRESSFEKQYRLEDAMQSAQVELMVAADIHHLVLPDGRVLADRLDWLLSLSKSVIKIPLVITGEPVRMNQLILADGRFCTRFWPIRLPGMPKEPEDPAARERLRKLLGLPDIPDES